MAFVVGDRVRITSKFSDYGGESDLVGRVGTVVGLDQGGPWPYNVEVDNFSSGDGLGYPFWDDELEAGK